MIACVRISHFAAAVERQFDPALAGVPLIVIAYKGQRGKVIAASREAELNGVSPGCSRTRARALCPKAVLISADPQQYEQALDHLLATLWTFTSHVEIDESVYPQAVEAYLDLGSLNERDLHLLGEQIGASVAATVAADVTIGIAQGKFPALVAARTAKAGQITLVPRGGEARTVAPCPVSFLPMSKTTARKLRLLCIYQVGELANLSRPALASAFGRSGRLLYWLSQGIDGRPVVPHRVPQAEHAVRTFDHAINDRHRLDVIIHAMADELASRLETRVAAAHHWTLTIQFERSKATTERLSIVQPVGTAQGIAQVLQPLIERSLPKLRRDGISGIEITAMQFVSAAPRQLELLTHRPARQLLIDLTPALIERYGQRFFEARIEAHGILLAERRFLLRKVGES